MSKTVDPALHKARREAARAAAAEKLTRKRWYITFSLRPAPRCPNRWGGIGYHKMAIGKLFKSEEEAWEYGRSWFTHPSRDWAGKRSNKWDKTHWMMPDGRRIVSYALSVTYVRKNTWEVRHDDEIWDTVTGLHILLCGTPGQAHKRVEEHNQSR